MIKWSQLVTLVSGVLVDLFVQLIKTFLADFFVFWSIGRADLGSYMLVIGEDGAEKQILIDCFYLS